jgi:hypothetical protein
VKIIYVARHNAGGNNDEDAIAYAFRELGHEVHAIPESQGFKALQRKADFVLFHKWQDTVSLQGLEGKMPKIFWWFDLVDFPNEKNEQVRNRCLSRMQWMENIIPLVDLGFMSDGDWVARDRTGRLVHLFQGADERYIGLGENNHRCAMCRGPWEGTDLLLTGIRLGGEKRMSFVADIEQHYGERFTHVLKGTHGRDLADLIACHKIILAPDHPVTDRYWSNRVFLSLGFGAFMLHPYCEMLADMYEDRKEIVFYHNREQLHIQIQHYLKSTTERRLIQQAALERTKKEHLYRHRCAKLIAIVKDRLGI